MKAKNLLLVLLLAFFMPGITQAAPAGITDEDLDYLGRVDGIHVRPVSLDPVFLKGTLSNDNQAITNTFFFNLGEVVFQITNKDGVIYSTFRTQAVEGGSFTIDIKGLPAGQYDIVCFIPDEVPQVAAFQVLK